MSKRIQAAATENIRALILDAGGNPVTGLTPAITIRRVSDDQFWNGSGYAAGDPTLTMSEVSLGTWPGWYEYDFDASAGATETDHQIEVNATGDADNVPQIGSFHVGEEWDNLDAPISVVDTVVDGIAVQTTAIAAGVIVVQEALAGRIEINITTVPWQEDHYDLATRSSIVRSFSLLDDAGANIEGDATSGNNPLNDPEVIVARKVLI